MRDRKSERESQRERERERENERKREREFIKLRLTCVISAIGFLFMESINYLGNFHFLVNHLK